MTTVILFVLGAFVGSFLNVIAERWGRQTFIHGRSRCPECGKILRWWELVPILSFFILRGRCRACNGKISWQYPITEALTGLAFATVSFLVLPVFCIYLVIAIHDHKHKIIPDVMAYLALVLAVTLRLMVGGSFLDWAAGPILFIIFGSLWLFSRGRVMGFGDAKLVLSIGFLLGAARGFSAVILAFWTGAAFALMHMILHKAGFLPHSKELTMKSEVPFAPFLILGTWLALVLGLDLLHVTKL